MPFAWTRSRSPCEGDRNRLVRAPAIAFVGGGKDRNACFHVGVRQRAVAGGRARCRERDRPLRGAGVIA
jgi:hypothetical protein